jgi:hypothetical protein
LAEVPTAMSAKTIERFLTVVATSGVPTKVDTKFLKSVGFKSGNDTSLIGVFKLLGFIDASQSPTQIWTDYRDKSRSSKVLGAAIKTAYSDLFTLYPDAHRKDDEAIRNWIRSATTAGEVTVQRATATFKALVAKADFDNIESTDTTHVATATAATLPVAPQGYVAPTIPQLGRSNPAVNINIELQVPATNDPKVYENFFAAMKKHLLDDGSDKS